MWDLSSGSKAAIASGISLARTTLETGNFVHDAKKGLWIEIALASECSLLTLCMDRRCVARGKPRNSGVGSCTNVSGLSVKRDAPGHHGYERAFDLISRKASNSHRRLSVFQDPPLPLSASTVISALTSAKGDQGACVTFTSVRQRSRRW